MSIEKVISSQIKEVFDRLQDKESKIIFMNRLQYYLSGDVRHIFAMVKALRGFSEENDNKYGAQTIDSFILDYTPDETSVVIYGAGIWGKSVKEMFTMAGIPVICFCDDNEEKQKHPYCGLLVISPETLVDDYRDSKVVVAPDSYAFKEIHFLMKHGFQENQIITLRNKELQYFGTPYFQPTSNEIFVDAGSMDGETLLSFGKWCNWEYVRIYSIEPDPENYKKLQRTVLENNIKHVTMCNEGLWSCNITLKFDNKGDPRSRIDNEGDLNVVVNTLDNIIGNDPVTFIKMDIEGAELEALKGSRETILRNKPRLAICIYHKPEDILEIPLYISHLLPEYKFYIRHHEWGCNETVLYATI